MTKCFLLSTILSISFLYSCSILKSGKNNPEINSPIPEIEVEEEWVIPEIEEVIEVEDSIFENDPNHYFKHVTILTDQNFYTTIKKGVVLVEFWATWCKPCLIQAPIVEKIGEKFKDQVTVAKVDVDQNQEISSENSITNIPTILIFKDGEEVERIIGLQTESYITELLKKYLKGGINKK